MVENQDYVLINVVEKNGTVAGTFVHKSSSNPGTHLAPSLLSDQSAGFSEAKPCLRAFSQVFAKTWEGEILWRLIRKPLDDYRI